MGILVRSSIDDDQVRGLRREAVVIDPLLPSLVALGRVLSATVFPVAVVSAGRFVALEHFVMMHKKCKIYVGMVS